VSWQQTFFEFIDTRSFTSIWFWIAVAVTWSSLSHFVMGVPFDMVVRAKRRGGQAQADLETLVRLQVERRLHIAEVSGMWLVGFAAAGLTTLGLLGFVYGIQFGQALFLLLTPATLVGLLGVLAARRLARAPLEGKALCRFLARQRMIVQGIGVISIIVIAGWAIWSIMTTSVLGR
jgi:hypothetical protein